MRVAVDGVEALEMWLERRADLVITDLGMPRLDGIGLLHKLRELDPRARVIATSASVSAEIKADVEQFSSLLQKPVSLGDLRRILRQEMLSRTASPTPAVAEPVRADALDALLRQPSAPNGTRSANPSSRRWPARTWMRCAGVCTGCRVR